MKIYYPILLSFLSLSLGAQNLVPNGSFEKFNSCPEHYSQDAYESHVKLWDSPNKGTPDYYNSCSKYCGVPHNWAGYADAYSGEAYMGLIACMEQLDTRQIAYREYIRIKLTKPLIKGQEYYASFQIQLGLSSIAACNGIGMFLSSSNMNTLGTVNYNVKPQIVADNIIADKKEWTQVCGSFIANGTETYVLIGNFLSNENIAYKKFDENLIPTQHISPMAYYYIDAIELHEFSDTLGKDCESINKNDLVAYEGEIEIDQKMVLSNLYFEIDKSVILKESFRELDQLAYQLRKNQRLKIKISGHTDSTGTVERNQQLSEDRAIAVRNYLLNKGVSKFRITTEGFGSSNPVSTNNTEQGRQLNRRVEIVIKD